ncbi:MAG: PadR family transcriptional regulator [Gemmatimonadetes bacterium]|nr:helix-turn-helix transcriptional regulator [Gemmatimonadota bacterium]NIR81520.1 helix-turn-helix transcriptional regulator [Gemmatimonadota bacterium]NIT90365.1 helix-turn-helix transcriptional regulator [Gemmatimonadota bacterium]NIU34193.1 helix-turn-helix transcriptional regulator [Gemmatimonadota bacterium]NIU38336.1 PadR family transcriptional regulator [Gemmatimonadota bacterium]
MTSEFLPVPDLSFHVLLALAEGRRHGWGVIKRIEEITEGRDSPSSGSLYLAMGRLEGKGLIEEAPGPPDGEDARRRYYRLTELGHRVLDAEVGRLAGLVDRARAAGVAGRG